MVSFDQANAFIIHELNRSVVYNLSRVAHMCVSGGFRLVGKLGHPYLEHLWIGSNSEIC